MGRCLRYLSGGESHGPALCAILEGLPAGLAVSRETIDRDLLRRQSGYGRGARTRSIENDRVEILAGMRRGETIGSPLVLRVQNRDFANWESVMSPDAVPGPSGAGTGREVTTPRPGHADLAGGLKFLRQDLRDVLERASARTTAARVAAGAVAKSLLRAFGIEVHALVLRIGGAGLAALPDSADAADAADFGALCAAAANSDLLCSDAAAEAQMKGLIDAARKEGDTLGGVFEVRATGVPAGLGSYSEWDRRLDGRLAQAVMSIQAVKGVEIGLGFAGAEQPGSRVHDAIAFDAAARDNRRGGFLRPTNRAGGIEGGVSNGEAVVVRAAMKPIATLAHPLPSVDLRTKQPRPAAYERSDVCAVPACAVIAEAAVALCLADAFLEKFGGDTMTEVATSFEGYLALLARA